MIFIKIYLVSTSFTTQRLYPHHSGFQLVLPFTKALVYALNVFFAVMFLRLYLYFSQEAHKKFIGLILPFRLKEQMMFIINIIVTLLICNAI